MNDFDRLKLMQELKKLLRYHSLAFYDPYPKQREFHENGVTFKERLLMAGNRLGKTFSAGMETAMHATGHYPSWWKGRRFMKPIRIWVGSVSAELCRDGAQRILLGPINLPGTGTIPKDRIVKVKMARGVPDAVESVVVKSIYGHTNLLVFKSYKDGREAWQADEIDVVWLDEEPPFDVYIEALTRTNNTKGTVFLTFTPLLGMSQVVVRYLHEKPAGTIVTQMGIQDALHYTDEEREAIIARYPPHERDARARGDPLMGEGLVFPIAEDEISEPPLPEIPEEWERIIGIDFGWDHPTAAVQLVRDPQTDVIHVVAAYRQTNQLPLVHAAAIRQWGDWIPVAWPLDGKQTEKGTGEQVCELYRQQGLAMISEYAQFPDKRGKSVDDGLTEIYQRMVTGRFKVYRTLTNWFEEFRMYHRIRDSKTGETKVVKQNDDLMSATRYAVMMLRYAMKEAYTEQRPDRYGRHLLRGRTWMSA